jgi:CBS domain containing-hemolysin-like protein
MSEPGILILKIAAVLVLVLLNGFFVAAEFAIVKIRDTQLDHLIQKGHRRARVARHILANLDRYLSAAQLGITLASLGLGALGEPVFTALLQPVLDWLRIDSSQVRHTVAVIVGLTILTFLHITAGEQAPNGWLFKTLSPLRSGWSTR